MRFVLAATAAVGLFGAGLAAADTCTQPRDKSAFDVAGLKSQLMVIALTCDTRDKYDSFVLRYRTALQGQEKALNGYFARTYGRRGQQQHDDYITQLANAQSETGLKRGTLFCQENVSLFDEVLGLPPSADLAGYAASKNLTQPIAFTVCPPKTPPKPAITKVVSRKAATATQ
jgi:hypothetical protein